MVDNVSVTVYWQAVESADRYTVKSNGNGSGMCPDGSYNACVSVNTTASI